ncbi:MAG: NAD-dependent epimerase/dehydratase family protein [Deltaproteobacteria bacterium]|nr:NAD-dependent epimerase/dehydratase family protein [Deltaproteobacteria bacterium]
MLVAVTGASGFVGSHVVKALLGHGHGVRAVVRDAADPARTDHLKSMGNVELMSADLTRPGSFDDAAQGCDAVVHAASATRLAARDPQREIVDVAVGATRTVLEGAARSSTVGRVVQTSSVAAVIDHTIPDSHVFTEDDWNESSTLDSEPYYLSKTLAEREALKIREQSKDAFELVSINPGFVLGPVLARIHLRSSPALVRQMLRGRIPGWPRISMPLVDARDVAEAHVLALEAERPSARYICNATTVWTRDVARTLATRFSDRKIPTRRIPDLMAWVGALFSKQLSFHLLRTSLGRFRNVSGEKLSSELGLEYRSPEDAIVDCATSIIDGGWA